MPITTQVSEDFDLIDLIREMPTAVTYGLLVTFVPRDVRREFYDAMAEWNRDEDNRSLSENRAYDEMIDRSLAL